MSIPNNIPLTPIPPQLPQLNLPLSNFFLDVIKQQHQQKVKHTALPMHFLSPNSVITDILFKKHISHIQRAIRASDRRANFFGRAIHSVVCNDPREAVRLMVKYKDEFQNQTQVIYDQKLRELKQDRSLDLQEFKQCIVYKFDSLKLQQNEICSAPGCFCVCQNAEELNSHKEIHLSERKFTFRCQICFDQIYSSKGNAASFFEGIYFDSLFDLILHVQKHKQFLRGTREGEVQCPLCDFRSCQGDEIDFHRLDHSEEDKHDVVKLMKKILNRTK